MFSHSNNQMIMPNRDHRYNSSSIQAARNQEKPPITITIRDKIIMNNIGRMVKTTAKLSSNIILIMIPNTLYIFTSDESSENLKYSLSLSKENTGVEVSRIEKFSIEVQNYFAQGLEWYLSEEDKLEILIEFQQKKMKLVSPDTNVSIAFEEYRDKFEIPLLPEAKWNFKISSSELDRLIFKTHKPTNSYMFFFNYQYSKVHIGDDSFNYLDNKKMGIEVDIESFNDLVKKVMGPRFKGTEGLCLSFKVDRRFMHYFSVVPYVFEQPKISKKQNKNKPVPPSNDPALVFGDKLYFRLKESQLNREDEGPMKTRASVCMSALRKVNGHIVEQFFFESETDINCHKTNDIFEKDSLKDFNEKENVKNFEDVSSFMFLTSSQNIVQIVENSNSSMNLGINRNLSNNNKSLLQQVKIDEVDESDLDARVKNDSNINNKNSESFNLIRSIQLNVKEESSVNENFNILEGISSSGGINSSSDANKINLENKKFEMKSKHIMQNNQNNQNNLNIHIQSNLPNVMLNDNDDYINIEENKNLNQPINSLSLNRDIDHDEFVLNREPIRHDFRLELSGIEGLINSNNLLSDPQILEGSVFEKKVEKEVEKKNPFAVFIAKQNNQANEGNLANQHLNRNANNNINPRNDSTNFNMPTFPKNWNKK